MQTLGADAVRVRVLWRVVAELARPTPSEIAAMRTDAQRRGPPPAPDFRGEDPRTYPTRTGTATRTWSEASATACRVLHVTGPGPGWGHRTAPPSQRLNRGTLKPYARASGLRQRGGQALRGTYPDENATRAALPRVTMWSLWNEPNQAGWLSPQWERRQGQLVPASPALYRRLFQAGRRAWTAPGTAGTSS